MGASEGLVGRRLGVSWPVVGGTLGNLVAVSLGGLGGGSGGS